MQKDNRYSLYVGGKFKGFKVSEKTKVKYWIFEIGVSNKTVWIKADDINSEIVSDAPIDELFKIRVDAVPYNGTAFLGYSICKE